MIISPYDVPKPCYIFRKKINSLFDSIQYEKWNKYQSENILTTSKPRKPPKPIISTSSSLDEGKNESSLKAEKLLMTTVSTPLTTILNVSTTDSTKTTTRATTSTTTKIAITNTTTTASSSSTSTTSTTPPSTTEYVPNYWDLLMNRYGLKTEGIEEGSSLPNQLRKAGETCTNTAAWAA